MIDTDMEGNIMIYRLPKGLGNDIARAGINLKLIQN
jgi:hypothetical protein